MNAVTFGGLNGAEFKNQQQGNQGNHMPFGSLFTPDQYNKILSMLNKPTLTEASANVEDNASTLTYLKWIIDTGAANHKVSDDDALKIGVSVGNSVA